VDFVDVYKYRCSGSGVTAIMQVAALVLLCEEQTKRPEYSKQYLPFWPGDPNFCFHTLLPTPHDRYICGM
jgi:hypothetical protein